MSITTGPLRYIPIERVQGLSPDIFCQQYLTGSGRPVVLTDAVRSWPALSRWSFQWFKTRYGSESVSPRNWVGSVGTKFQKIMTLGDFIDYLDAPDKPSPGLWIDTATLHPSPGPTEALEHPLYLAWSIFAKHPELLEDVELSPKFVEDWVPLFPKALRAVLDGATRYFTAGILMGSRDSQMGVHYDFLDSHAYLAQMVGRKRCVLFSPEDSAALYNGKVDVDRPDLETFPLFQHATAYECVLEPGQLLFIPYRWWHHVVSLEKTITVNYNFFNHVNFSGYMTHLLQILPALVDGIADSPEERAALGIQWTCRGFDFRGSGTA